MPRRKRLPDAALVIRGGRMENITNLRSNATIHHDRLLEGFSLTEWAISVHSLPETGIRTLCRAAKKGNGYVCVSTAGLLRLGGFGLRPDWRPDGHTNLVFRGEPSDDELRWLTHLFSRPVQNAGRVRK